MSIVIGLRVVTPKGKKLADPTAYKRETNKLLSKTGKELDRDMNRPTDTWSSPITTRKQQGDNYVQVTTNDKRWYYLNKGTSIRWAIVTPDFESKTWPNSLDPRPGRGRVLIRGKRAMLAAGIPPRPGIQARNWINEISKLEQPVFQSRYSRILQDGRIFWN